MALAQKAPRIFNPNLCLLWRNVSRTKNFPCFVQTVDFSLQDVRRNLSYHFAVGTTPASSAMLFLLCLSLSCARAAGHLLQGSAVQWPNGPLPSTQAAQLLVEAENARRQLPYSLAGCCLASCIGAATVFCFWQKCKAVCQSYVRAEGFTFFRGRRGNAEAELVDLEAGLISPLGFGPPAAAPLKPSGQAQCSARSLCKIQALVRGAVQRAAFVRARAACILIQRAWRRVCRIDALGKKLLRQAPVGTFPALHFDSEDLQEGAFTEKEKWLVLKAAPTFVQRIAPVAMMFGVEARRLTLARLCGDIGSATASEEEIEETGGLTVFAAQKVVGGLFAKVHCLSSGSVLELEGLGSYQSCGAGKALVHELEAFAKEEGHFAIILLAAPSAIAFYEWLGFVKATDARTPVGQALFYLSSKAQFQHLPMLKCMDAM